MTQLLINLDVDDLARAEAFYTGVFGLHVGRRMGADVVELLGAAVPLYLLRKPAGSTGADACGGRGVRDYGRHWTPVHLDFVVDDVDSTVERALAAGATLVQAARTHAWGRIAVMADPFGHGFCVLRFLGRGYDEVATE